MCGIYGAPRTNDLFRAMSPLLATYMESRGRDSWGVTDGNEVFKEAKAITDGFVEFGFESVLYHTRAASVGKVSDRNAHPFDFSAGTKRVVGAHNGHLSNWQRLKESESRSDLEVDSEHIFRHLAEDKDVGLIDGWGAVVWYEMPIDAPLERRLFCSKFGSMDNLHICRLDDPDGTVVYASTQEAITKTARMYGVKVATKWKIENNHKYEMGPDPAIDGRINLFERGEMPWGKNVAPLVSVAYVGGSHYLGGYEHSRHRGGSSTRMCDTFCNAPTCPHKLEHPSDLLCQACADRLAWENFGLALSAYVN